MLTLEWRWSRSFIILVSYGLILIRPTEKNLKEIMECGGDLLTFPKRDPIVNQEISLSPRASCWLGTERQHRYEQKSWYQDEGKKPTRFLDGSHLRRQC